MCVDITKPNEVADLFVALCVRLRTLGATKVEAFGCVANFAFPTGAKEMPVAVPTEPVQPEPDEPLSPEGRELRDRARQFAGGRA